MDSGIVNYITKRGGIFAALIGFYREFKFKQFFKGEI